MTNPNDPAFSDEIIPIAIPGPNPYVTTYKEKRCLGLSKREYFAAMAMQGILANGQLSFRDFETNCLLYADALIAELNK